MDEKEWREYCKKEFETAGFKYSDEDANRILDCVEDFVKNMFEESGE